jgi:hypothetical protein
MKCLSLKQPFATLVMIGAKRVETRSWPTAHRGPLAIHAARHFGPAARALCEREPFRARLKAAGYPAADRLPLGALLGTVDVTDCRPAAGLGVDPASEEAALGDFRPGRWGWVLDNVSRLLRPVPCAGRLRLFDVAHRFRRGCFGLIAEEQWATERDPEVLFTVLGDAVSGRKLRLFAVACYRRFWHALTEAGRRLVERAERLADAPGGVPGRAAPEAAAFDGAGNMVGALLSPDGFEAASWATDDTLEALERYCAARKFALGLSEALRRKEQAAQAELLRDVAGNIFRPPSPVAPAVLAWNEAAVRRIAEGIYEERAFDRLPILADALLDAGCDDERLIGHCHSGGPHARGCWAVDLILGKT